MTTTATVDFHARPLSVGVYDATDEFRAIGQHACVCYADNLGLVAVVGRADDPEAQLWADLFAASADLLAALEAVLPYADSLLADFMVEAEPGFEGDPAGGRTANDYLRAVNGARAAIAKAKGEA